jgi:hypothetical protein
MRAKALTLCDPRFSWLAHTVKPSLRNNLGKAPSTQEIKELEQVLRKECRVDGGGGGMENNCFFGSWMGLGSRGCQGLSVVVRWWSCVMWRSCIAALQDHLLNTNLAEDLYTLNLDYKSLEPFHLQDHDIKSDVRELYSIGKQI